MPRPRPAARPFKIGLALAGGGPEGAVYEIGALRALEEALEGIEFHRLDHYVGVSAGAFVAANLANEVTSSQLVRALVKHEAGEHPFIPSTFFTPAYLEWAKRSLMLPQLAATALSRLIKQPKDQTFLAALTRLARALPVGFFDNEPIRRFLEKTFSLKGRTDDFRKLKHPLIVVAADLGSGQAIRFGEPGWDHVPISTAVQASTALPGVYPPVKVDGRYCVDGVLLRTLHASVALEAGVDLLLCVNPLVPADLRGAERLGAVAPGIIVRRGLPTVLAQAFRTLIYSRLQVGMASYKRRFPNAVLLVFQPEHDEHRMFFTNILSFAARRAVCELAYESTRRDLLRRKDELIPVLRHHGITLRVAVLEDPTRTVWNGVGLADEEVEGSGVGAKLGAALESLDNLVG